MNKGLLLSIAISVLAMGGVVAAFMSNSSPYVTVAQAREVRRDQMHLAGDILKATLLTDPRRNEVRFRLKDASGDEINVIHRGEFPSNLNAATKVVAIGGMEGDHFASKQMLVKCPSRYEGTDAKDATK